MRAVKAKNTSPELAVRKLLRAAGARFQVYANLPGRPDIVLPRQRQVIFVHGCFWHGHSCVRGRRTPKTNTDYWLAKIMRNKLRDRHTKAMLKKAGWGVAVVWECELRRSTQLAKKLATLIDATPLLATK